MATAFRTLMGSLIDYAGLFPPARLGMSEAVDTYVRHAGSAHAWMLSAFIVPAARLGEFESEMLRHREREAGPRPWSLSLLAGGAADVDAAIDAAIDFRTRHGEAVRIAAMETRGEDPRAIEALLDRLHDRAEDLAGLAAGPGDADPAGVDAAPMIHVEIPVADDCRGLVAALAGSGHGAKIRTGGVTADAFPPPEAVARFITACDDADVPFKATAGLHHPVRHFRPDVNAPMHGFFNVFGAAALRRTQGAETDDVRAVLEIEDPSAFAFTDETFTIGERTLSLEALEQSRKWARSYGSCSFAEPVEDLVALGLLAARSS